VRAAFTFGERKVIICRRTRSFVVAHVDAGIIKAEEKQKNKKVSLGQVFIFFFSLSGGV
jgi:hypothetical protein